MKNKCICGAPFFYMEIDANDCIYPCCPALAPAYGKVENFDFEKVYNGDFSKEFRASIINGNYKYCKIESCNPIDNRYYDKVKLTNQDFEISEEANLPTFVKFTHDRHCNIKCITCRNEYINNNRDLVNLLNSKIDSLYLPILKNAQVVSLCGAGEALASEHCKTLIKRIAETYPNIKFEIHTNGILCCEKVLSKLGILDRLIGIDVSMHGINKKTVEKIMKGTNYALVRKNLEWISSLKKNNKIKYFNLCYVVNSINYREMKRFVLFAQDLDADVYFWEYRKWGTEFDKNYDKWAVFEPQNIHYNSFVKMLKDPIFKDPRVHMNNKLFLCRPIPTQKYISYRVKEILEFLKKIFDVKNEIDGAVKHKVFVVLGIKFKFKLQKGAETRIKLDR